MAAKRYQVQVKIPLTAHDEGEDIVAEGQIDIALLLSQRLQKNVRQGRTFKVHTVETSILPQPNVEYDTGLAIGAEIRWCPASRKSVQAWQHLYSVWRKQKGLRVGAMGMITRYDDFEIAFNEPNCTTRTSTVYTDGMGDSDTERCIIYGNSGDFADGEVSLEDLAISAQPVASPSRFPISNAVVKTSKFDEMFPAPFVVQSGAHFSSVFDPSFDSGASFGRSYVPISDNSTVAGVLAYKIWALAEDTMNNVSDEAYAIITLTVSMGSSMVPSSRSKKGGKRHGHKSHHRSTSKS